MELKAVGTGKHRHWLVDYFEPLGGGLSQPANPGQNPIAASTPVRSATKAALGIQWVFVPLSIFALVLAHPDRARDPRLAPQPPRGPRLHADAAAAAANLELAD
jgi:hypothetical protein